MDTNLNFLIDKIFEKIKEHKRYKIILKKEEFEKFIFFLINNS